MEKNILSKEVEQEFKQKQVNHVFHYTKRIEFLLQIIENGFFPSYCYEKINDLEYYIPMVSFCNIPLKDVDDYLRYGNYGIGLSLVWAVKHSISPVVYIHENTPFADLHRQINKLHISEYLAKTIKDVFNKALDGESISEEDDLEDPKMLMAVNEITVPAVQFFKNWKTTHKGNEVITYLEREWRYVPQLPPGDRLISNIGQELDRFNEIAKKEKPHFDIPLEIVNINDIRYLMVHEEKEREDVLEVLNRKFGKETVYKSITSGDLLILTNQQIRNDF
jgi:hypothetical protein